jgi:hypothetical protein
MLSGGLLGERRTETTYLGDAPIMDEISGTFFSGKPRGASATSPALPREPGIVPADGRTEKVGKRWGLRTEGRTEKVGKRGGLRTGQTEKIGKRGGLGQKDGRTDRGGERGRVAGGVETEIPRESAKAKKPVQVKDAPDLPPGIWAEILR